MNLALKQRIQYVLILKNDKNRFKVYTKQIIKMIFKYIIKFKN